jgi:hypothetical protein
MWNILNIKTVVTMVTGASVAVMIKEGEAPNIKARIRASTIPVYVDCFYRVEILVR